MTPQQSIAHYRITGKLGEGGMGAVYRATDTKLNRDVAIKVLPDSMAQDPSRMLRFSREAQVLASLNHPNIAAIYGVEDRALVMELVEGATLEERIAQGAIPLDESIAIARQIAEALEYAHEKGVIHRDLKPANIKITPAGRLKVLDFGLAKALSPDVPDASGLSATMTLKPTLVGMIMGTPGYMSPEQAKGKPLDRRADIWAFGVVLWEMLTGRPLFQGETAPEIMAQVLTTDPDVEQAPAKVQKVLRACLQKDPAMRLRSIGDWPLLLQEAGTGATSRSSILPWVVVTLAVLVAVVAVWGWLRRPPATAQKNFNLDITPPEGESLYQDSAIHAISPDGRLLAFLAESKGRRRIWIRPLDSASARPLAGTEFADGLVWSPDSRNLGFSAGSKLERVDTVTGVVKEVCEAGSSIRGFAWGPGNVILLATSAMPLQRISADGGTPVVVSEYAPKEVSHHSPQFLPDGKRFLYWIRGSDPSIAGVYSGSLDFAASKQPRNVILKGPSAAMFAENPGQSSGALLFLRGRTLFAQPFDPAQLSVSGAPRPIAENVGARAQLAQFSVSRTGILVTAAAGNLFRTVTIVSRDGTAVQTVGKPGAYSAFALSPDERTLALVHNEPDASLDLWLMDLARGVPVRFTNALTVTLGPTWSSDSRELMYSSHREGHYRIYRKAVAGNSPESAIATEDKYAVVSSWSRNPESVWFTGREGAVFSLFMMPLQPGSKPIAVESSKAMLHGAKASHSGRWFAFTSTESGNREVYVQAVPGTQATPLPKIRVSGGGGTNPRWRDDDSELYFNSLDDHLMVVSTKTTGGQFEASEPKELFPIAGSSSYNGAIYWEPFRGGQRFVVLRSTPVSSSDNRLNVLTNWPELLKSPE